MSVVDGTKLLPAFTGDTTKFLRGDGTFATPPAGGSPPTGTGFRHVTAGVEDAASKLVDTADVNADQITYAKIQNIAATARLLGRITAGAGDIEELTGTQATTLLDAFTSALKGLVPASGGGTTNFLRADGTFAAPTAAAADPAYSPGSFTVATETGRLIIRHMKLTTTQRATLAGTATLRLG